MPVSLLPGERTATADPIKVARKKRNRKRRLFFYGGLLLAFWAFWAWQPWELDLIERSLPVPHPPVDPDSKRLFSPGTKIAVVVGHPDDAEFYIGGALTRLGRNSEITLIACTDGDKAYYPFEDWETNRKVRRQEQTEATRIWGGKHVVFLGFPDGRLRVTKALEDSIAAQLERIKPDYVLSFDGEYPPRFSHQDHRRTGEAVANVLNRRPDLCRWLMRFSTMTPNYVVDISDQWEAKRELLAIHKSQFFGERLRRVTNMVQNRAIEDGERIGVTYGEGFRCLRMSPWPDETGVAGL
ncbi:MAG: hypothetical protein HONBIEJF_01114 [Fimbriimonadaceae bacterium]|nr:hypothetical protein [Fimbriimonadaceae bacterium]